MQKVFSWKAFASFVYKQTRYKVEETGHPVLDAVATELHTGQLIRRDRKGNPVEPWLNPLELRKSYLDPTEVNRLAIMQRWRLVWTPTAVTEKAKTSSTPTVAQQVQLHGWKVTLQAEATRLWKEQTSLGAKPVLAAISKRLHQFALDNKIVGDHGKTPSAGYIRSHVISVKAWKRPL
jgi:hypothetical protein